MRTRVMRVLTLTLVVVSALGFVPPHATVAAQAAPQAAPQAAGPAAGPAAGSGSGYVVVLGTAKEYHWPSCPLVKDAKDAAVLSRAQANGKGLQPHAACDPKNAPADGKSLAAAYVYVAKGDTRYHRAECKVLPKDAKRVVLDKDAVRGRWQCTQCRPPILRPASAPSVP